MTPVTLALAALGSIIALRCKPSLAFCIYCAGLFLYPQALTVQLGSADFSLSRILILPVLANALIRAERHRSFEWSWVDVCVCASYLLGSAALLHTVGTKAIERQGGALFDTVLPYFAARLIFTSAEDFTTLAKGLVIIAVPLVVLGVSQTLTGRNPVGDLSMYYHVGLQGNRAEEDIPRLGLYRAAVTFTHPIAFGLFCAMVAPLTMSLWHQGTWPRGVVAALVAVACAGVFESLSSGPWLALGCTALVFLTYLSWRLTARVVVYGALFVLGCLWYASGAYLDLLAAFSFKPLNSLYRVGLIREAFGGGMTGHWLTGFGYVGVGPGNDNSQFHWRYNDTVNLYIQMLVRTGLLGVTPYVVATGLYFARLRDAIRAATRVPVMWLAVSMLAAMVGWNVGLMTVGALSQIAQLLYTTIGISTNMPGIVTSENRRGP